MRIGIELNGIIRNINEQILDYYVKDFDKTFDKDKVKLNRVNFIKQIPFKSQKDVDKFMYVDYPYEVFGCAGTCSMHLPNTINTWHKKNDKKIDLVVFSLMESGLSIQSTYFFLSKIGCKIREAFFPKKAHEIWNKCDVVITTNKDVVKSKPKYKKVVLIEKNDNKYLVKKADLVYKNLDEVCNDKDFFKKIGKIKKPSKNNLWQTIKKLFTDGKSKN